VSEEAAPLLAVSYVKSLAFFALLSAEYTDSKSEFGLLSGL
jgi:hypothetical protein